MLTGEGYVAAGIVTALDIGASYADEIILVGGTPLVPGTPLRDQSLNATNLGRFIVFGLSGAVAYMKGRENSRASRMAEVMHLSSMPGVGRSIVNIVRRELLGKVPFQGRSVPGGFGMQMQPVRGQHIATPGGSIQSPFT